MNIVLVLFLWETLINRLHLFYYSIVIIINFAEVFNTGLKIS